MNSIEILESRIAPASIIDVLVSGGNLIIKTSAADDGAEQIAITQGATPDAFKIDPGSGTQIRFNGTLNAADALVEVTGVKKDISISLGKDSDTVTMTSLLVPGAVKVDLGEGATNSFTLETTLAASVSYKGGSGGDSVDLSDVAAGGKVDLALGNGANSLTFDDLQIAGDFSVKGGVDADTLTNPSGTSNIGGKLTVQLGDGANSVSSQGAWFVGKDAAFTAGKNDDAISFSSSGAMTFGGSLTFNTGKGSDSAGISASQGIHVGKNLSFLSAGRVEPTDMIGQSVTAGGGLSVGGNVTFTGGESSSTSQLILTPTGNIAVIGKVSFKAQGDSVTQQLLVSQMQIGGALTMDAKEKGTAGGITQQILANVAVPISQITGPVSMTGGDIVALTVPGDIIGAVKISTGGGVSASLNIGSNAANFAGRIYGGLTVNVDKSATGSSTGIAGLKLGGALSFTGSAAADWLYLEELVVSGATKIETGDGADNVYFEANASLPFVARYFGPVSVKTGAGADNLFVAGSAAEQKATFLGKALFDTGGTGENLLIYLNASFLIPAVLVN